MEMKQKTLDSIIEEEKKLTNEIAVKKEELKKEEEKQEKILKELYELEYELSKLENNKKFIQNIPETIKQEKKKIVSKELMTFLILSLIIAGVSVITLFVGFSGFVIPAILSGLSINALGCTINGSIDFAEYKNKLKDFDLNQTEEKIALTTKKINNKKAENVEVKNNIKNLNDIIRELLNNKDIVGAKLSDIRETYINIFNEYEFDEENKTIKK